MGIELNKNTHSHNDTLTTINVSVGVSGKILKSYIDDEFNKVITAFRVDSASFNCPSCNCNTFTHGCFCGVLDKTK